ncbi:putative WRKY transcription factor 58 [Hibiscus syriacus]|uniref:WRKY transcription factor 58 n=1 Tax=Hibiscus syriacus TaxID=106335 RepID=A0A6A2X3V9_HIBSY|nr:probable WRKY transcription factor 4 [Hibiscus syriacus]KAE8669491.1 putative WRKY transcription factor 58 [Hibiscus syriacus]
MADKEKGTRSKLSAPTRPSITLPPKPAMDGLFSGLSPGPMTLVSAFFPDLDSTERPFSQLLASAMASPGARLPYNLMDGPFMDVGFKDGAEKSTGFKQNRPLNFDSPFFTVPPGLSPSGLLNSPSFFCLSPQSPFGISHQQALAEVTAQAALAQSHVRPQTEYQALSVSALPESLICHPSFTPEEASQLMPHSASEPQSSLVEYSEASRSDRKNKVSVVVDKPAEDGYNWRKYGQKPIKGCEYPRSYYKCTHSNCPVKKKVERSADGHITEIIYKGAHNHDKPQPNKQTKGGCDGDANSQTNPEFGSQGAASNSNKLSETMLSHSIQGENGESIQAAELPGSSDSEEGCDEESREERNDNGPNPKRRNTAGEASVMLPKKTVTEPKIVLQTRSEVDLLDDGYRWRKYGQKVVKGNSHPRSYYKCTSAGCNVRKHVERASTDPKAVITTYEGKHNHDVPSARNSSHNTVRSSLLQSKPEKVVADTENGNHSLLKVMDFGNNGRGPAVLRLKEEQIRV